MYYEYPETEAPFEVSIFYMQCALKVDSVVEKGKR